MACSIQVLDMSPWAHLAPGDPLSDEQTRLAQQVAESLRETGCAIVSSAALQVSAVMPYGPRLPRQRESLPPMQCMQPYHGPMRDHCPCVPCMPPLPHKQIKHPRVESSENEAFLDLVRASLSSPSVSVFLSPFSTRLPPHL